MDISTLPLLTRLLRDDCPESTKRAMALMAGGTLCFGQTVLILAVWYQALLKSAVDGNLVTCLGLVSASVAGLAGVAYRKREDGIEASIAGKIATNQPEGAPQ